MLIGLREGLETSIVVSILIAFLVKSGRRDALKWVWLGVAGGAIAMTLGVFLTIQFSAYTVSGGLGAEAIAGGVASLVAVVIVTTMVLWMKSAAASLSGELKTGGMARALDTGGLAVTSLAFLAVGREGVETALFMVGFAEAETLWPLVGLVVGVLIAIAIAYAMYAGGAVRINLAKFFQYTAVFLILVAAGILSYGVGALQTVGWLPGLAHKAFDISSWFNWSSWYGQVIQGVFNVTPTPHRAAVRGGMAGLSGPGARGVSAAHQGAGRIGRRPPHPTTRRRIEHSHGPGSGTVRHLRKVDHVNNRTALTAALLAGLALAGCTAKESANSSDPAKPAAGGDHRHRLRRQVRAVGHRGQDRCDHVQHHQQRHQGHRVLRVRRGRAGDGRGGEHLPPGCSAS